MDAVTRAVASGEDLYALLGVPPESSDDDIRHAYRTLARRHHPDANPDEAEADGSGASWPPTRSWEARTTAQRTTAR